MKVRLNKRRTLSNLRQNKKHRWFVAKCTRGYEKLKERNDRIKLLVDKL